MMTASDKLADLLIRRHIFVQRFSNNQAAKVLRAIKRLAPRVAEVLAESIMAEKVRGAVITPAQLRRAMRKVDSTISEALRDDFAELATSLEEFADTEAAFYADALTTAIRPALIPGAVVPVAAITGAQVAAAAFSAPFQGNTLLSWPDDLAAWAKRLITNQVRAGYLMGKPTMEIVAGIKATWRGKFSSGVSSVVKSAVNHYSATARELMVSANADVVKCRRWLSTLDTHTSPMCQLRDRLFYPLKVKADTEGSADRELKKHIAGSQYGAGPGKLHYCCRSTETWVIRGLDDWPDSTRPALKTDPTTGRYMSESVSEGTTYFEWVQRQPRHVLEEIYGIERADQILRGLKVPKMFNDSGELYPIAQLKNKGLWRD